VLPPQRGPQLTGSTMAALAVVCPEGAQAGELLSVPADGDTLEVVIPEGAGPGDTFEIVLTSDAPDSSDGAANGASEERGDGGGGAGAPAAEEVQVEEEQEEGERAGEHEAVPEDLPPTREEGGGYNGEAGYDEYDDDDEATTAAASTATGRAPGGLEPEPEPFSTWRKEADRLRVAREEMEMLTAKQKSTLHRTKIPESQAIQAIQAMGEWKKQRDAEFALKRAQLERETQGTLHRDTKHPGWDGEGGLLSRLYKPKKPPPKAAKAGSGAGSRGSWRPSSASPTPSSPSAPPSSLSAGATRGGGGGGGGGGTTDEQRLRRVQRELSVATAERDALKEALAEAQVELEAIQEEQFDAQAELDVSREEEAKLRQQAEELQTKLGAVLARAKSQGMDLEQWLQEYSKG
jgi:hypothetical protein